MPSDNFIDDPQQDQSVPQVFNVDGNEYTPEQLKKYIELGKIGEEAEEKYNTKIDRVWQDYTKKSQELKSAKERLSELEQMAQQQQAVTPISDENQDQAIREAKQAAKKIGIVTDEDFEGLMAKAFRKYYQQERESEKIYNQAVDLEGKYNGADGRPRFVAQDMLQFMVDNEIRNPEIAYKIRYEQELDSWKEAQLSKVKKPGMVTEDSSATNFKAPKDVRVTKDNLGQLVSEALNLPAE